MIVTVIRMAIFRIKKFKAYIYKYLYIYVYIYIV